MGTVIRPQLSQKNKYYLERHRYYELKHFCLQYPIWKKAYNSLDGLSGRSSDIIEISRRTDISDPTAKVAEAKAFYKERLEMVERCAEEADPVIGPHILVGVTEGLSYEKLNARHTIPCGKDMYYELYRKFFWLLNKVRQ